MFDSDTFHKYTKKDYSKYYILGLFCLQYNSINNLIFLMNNLQFYGAAGTVTGSKYLLNVNKNKYLIDCGLFQGPRELREMNWAKPSFNPSEIKAVLLTHAHIDHTGFLPRLYKLGLRCPIYCTSATQDLCKILLPDTGRLQEEETEFRQKSGRSRHHPPLALYTEKDALETLKLFKTVDSNRKIFFEKDFSAEWFTMGHIIGASGINLRGDDVSITFSGDIGRYNVPILKDPQLVELGKLLLIESTYGDRLHSETPVKEQMATIINQTVKRGGAVVIPSFAVGRAQTLLYFIRELKNDKLIPDIPVIIDSPMASDATTIYQRHADEFDQAAKDMLYSKCSPFACSNLAFTQSATDSKKLNTIHEPMIIISASGMLTGGRILHHLYNRISSPKNTILFVGYQSPGGRGAWIKSGATSLKLLGEEVAIHAQISEISGLSAHGDYLELLRWAESCQGTPQAVAVVHGEPESAKVFADKLKSKFNWNTFIPAFGEQYNF